MYITFLNGFAKNQTKYLPMFILTNKLHQDTKSKNQWNNSLPALWIGCTEFAMIPLVPSVCTRKHQQNLSDEEYPWWGQIWGKLLSGSSDDANVSLRIEKGGENSGCGDPGDLEWNRRSSEGKSEPLNPLAQIVWVGD